MDQLFRVFKEVAETNNISLSAKRLHMSQPNVSLQIHSLEKEYGVRFFDRTNKGVTLTQEGEIFYTHVLKVLDVLKSLKAELSTLEKDPKRLIFLGATLTIGEYVLPKILAFLSKIHPNLDFKVKIANTESIIQDVAEKKMHIGLIEGPLPKHDDLMVEKFWEDELVVLVPNFHPWASKESIALSELSTERLVTREEGSGTRRVLEMALEERGLNLSQLNVTMELESIQAIKQVVSAGLGITIISSLTVNRESDQDLFKMLKIEDALVYRPLSILTNVHTTQTNDEQILISLLHDQELLADILGTDHDECKLYLPHSVVSNQEGQGHGRGQWQGH